MKINKFKLYLLLPEISSNSSPIFRRYFSAKFTTALRIYLRYTEGFSISIQVLGFGFELELDGPND
jgi:hypothetical protein